MDEVTDLAGLLDYDPVQLSLVPRHLRPGLRRYIEDGVRPGDGLTGILSNAPLMHVLTLDELAFEGLRNTLKFIHNYAPGRCHGSEQICALWCDLGGLKGWLKYGEKHD